MSPRTVDAIVIGSGHNGLVAASYLARAGWEVEVLERNAELGGAVATEELTLPGYRHDTFSSWHPLFRASATFAELGPELTSRGLDYVNTDTPAATAFGDGDAVVLYRDRALTETGFLPDDGATHMAELDRFALYADHVGELLATELQSSEAARTAVRLAWRLRANGVNRLARDVLSSARGWLTSRFVGEAPSRLYAPWVLHTGLSPDDAGGGFQLLALAAGLHLGGAPLVRGGSAGFVRAFERLIADHGGQTRTGADVTEVLVSDGCATGVVVAGERLSARRAVIANVTPTQLYGQLLRSCRVPPRITAEASRYRYGRGAMQLHLALSGPLRWRDPRLDQTAIVHITEGIDDVALACAQAAAGLLPERPTIVCGQPTVLDPSRAPDGAAILWIQLQEVPSLVRGDAAGELDVGSGEWTPALASAYADRVIERIASKTRNLADVLLARAVLSPTDLQRRNVNLVAGDPYGGATTLDQSLLWRPLPSSGSHRTPIKRLWQCGASTYPGPGLNAASGRIVARSILGSVKSRRSQHRALRVRRPSQRRRTDGN